jgi:hypothetical protein
MVAKLPHLLDNSMDADLKDLDLQKAVSENRLLMKSNMKAGQDDINDAMTKGMVMVMTNDQVKNLARTRL